MKKLFIKLSVLFILVGLIVLIIALLNKRAIMLMMNNDAFILKDSINTLVIGDSHAEASLDPDILKGSVNISASGESVFFTYFKLKYFTDRNENNIDNVVLSLSYHNIAKKFQEDYLFEDSKSDFSLNNYYLYLNSESKKIVKNSNKYVKYMMKYNYGLPFRQYSDLMVYRSLYKTNLDTIYIKGYGGYSKGLSSSIDQDKILLKINEYFYDDNEIVTEVSNLMLDYIYKIVDLCSDNGIQLYIYNSPLHPYFYKEVPAKIYDAYYDLLDDLKENYENVTIIDFSSLGLSDHMFSDGDHLNHLGAAVISQKMNDILDGRY